MGAGRFSFFKVITILLLLFFVEVSSYAATLTVNRQAAFLSVADIHFDPFLSCSKDEKPCPLIEALRRAPTSQWQDIFDQYNRLRSQYYHDTHHLLLKSTLQEMKDIANKADIKFVLILGDFLGHDFKKSFRAYSSDKTDYSYQAFVRKTMGFLSNEINHAFPTVDVFIALGNNDSYKGDYHPELQGLFLQDMAELWSKTIKDSVARNIMQNEFLQRGYYSINIPKQPTLRLIVLNSVLFYKDSLDKKTTQAAIRQLAWLHDELEAVKQKNQKAIIAFHIPPSVDVYLPFKKNLFISLELWQKQYIKYFQAELTEFSTSMMAVLPAHIHVDWFQIIPVGNGEKVLMNTTPAISPLFGNNPAFKVFSYAVPSLDLLGFSTYFYSFDTRKWLQEYSFNIQNPTNHNGILMGDGMSFIKLSGQLAAYYKWTMQLSPMLDFLLQTGAANIDISYK
ncbi:MAG: hypothetical protein A3F11_03395 [Gammaproteobacteria bacterium RIFCSPHIGHO2_12_FULL_37_14]|nr:MAG: hypothetical protein A3F11_03395 [Gammaproteobacteria bacterium RIFCSPHIGHO2_12_FULL_37_14]